MCTVGVHDWSPAQGKQELGKQDVQIPATSETGSSENECLLKTPIKLRLR